jgi:8-oxo-dGTP pyrophosphatase MutT (NUDIX family)
MSAHPEWLKPFAELPDTVTIEHFTLRPQNANGATRDGAVLVLLGESENGPDVLLTQRSRTMRSHAGQPAFPGGAVDENDAGPAETALREAAEETGLDISGVEVLGLLPRVWLPPSNFLVTPVLAWWHTHSPVSAVDPREVSKVVRVALRDLINPENRFRIAHPGGLSTPAFAVSDMRVWGFTAVLLDRLLALAGWEEPWDQNRFEELGET